MRRSFVSTARPGRAARRPFRPTLEALEERWVPATLPTGFTEAVVASGLTNATTMEFSPSGLLFVAEQAGTMEVFQNGTRLQSNFFRDTPLTVNSSGERGLLGIAFDPNYASNRYVYVYYTATTPAIHNRVSRFTAADASGQLALAGSETIILELNNLSSATNHNGGAIHFGPDGKLYIATGENANGSNAQTLGNLLGKMLRINKDGTIPMDNPFYNSATGQNRAIWALGLRNPFTFAFQPGTTRVFINDVGGGSWEEINDGIAGSNYGWPNSEGFKRAGDPATTIGTYRDPLLAYGHGTGPTVGCAITGGAFYNPTTPQFPASYTGDYFFADYCGGWIRTYDPGSGTASGFATGISNPVDLRVDSNGNLYYLARTASRVFQVQFTGNQAPTITQHPASQTISEGQPVTFTVSATGTAPLSYQWQRNGTNISGATASSYTISAVTTADNGAAFRAVVSNAFGNATSNAATLTVTPNQGPTATITAPADGTLYNAGDTINYVGTGTDPEDGTLPASAFTWEVLFHHDTHTHPFVQPTSGPKSGSFTIPTTGETSANVFYRIHLTVTDAGGLTSSTFVDVVPRTVTITLATSPSGLQLKLDDQPVTAPTSFVGVVGMQRKLEAPSPQTVGGTTYVFSNWSDGGAATHTITTPASNTTYTAVYTPASSSFSAFVNFQPANVPVPSGYVADAGKKFANRGNGLTYGWTDGNYATARDRNSPLSPDQRYDTLVHMQHSFNRNAVWEIAVPNGTYTVHLVAGDPTAFDSVYKINVEGVLAVNGTPTSQTRWIEATVSVTVTDGRLTVSNAPGAVNNKINFIDITADSTGGLRMAAPSQVAAGDRKADAGAGRKPEVRRGDRREAVSAWRDALAALLAYDQAHRDGDDHLAAGSLPSPTNDADLFCHCQPH